MDKDIELIHRVLDGEIPQEEKADILNLINSDPPLKNEFNDLFNTIRLVEDSERLTLHASFTSDVMKRLPKKDLYRKRTLDFFFKGRVLRWNMAAALATVFFLVIAFAGIFQFQKKHNLISHSNLPAEPAIVVKINFFAPRANKVAIAGDFNKWKVDEILSKQDNGNWTIEIPLKPGVYYYMFLVDGKVWVTDPNAEAYRDDGFGYKNSVLRVSKL